MSRPPQPSHIRPGRLDRRSTSEHKTKRYPCLPGGCGVCGGRLTYDPSANRYARDDSRIPPDPGEIRLCLRCVNVALCRMAVLRHGHITPSKDPTR